LKETRTKCSPRTAKPYDQVPPIFIAQRDQYDGVEVRDFPPCPVFASLKGLRDRIVWTRSNDDLVASGRDDTSASRARVTPHVIRTVRILVVGVGIADEVNGTVCSEIHTYCRMLFVFLVPQLYQIILII